MQFSGAAPEARRGREHAPGQVLPMRSGFYSSMSPCALRGWPGYTAAGRQTVKSFVRRARFVNFSRLPVEQGIKTARLQCSRRAGLAFSFRDVKGFRLTFFRLQM